MDFGDPRLPQRFWDKVEVDSESGCWMWTGYCDKDDYPRFSVQIRPGKSRHVLAHRYLYMKARGLDYFTDLDDMDIHHVRCRNRPCVREEHLGQQDRIAHRRHHGKMKNYAAGACSMSEWCMCERCCDEREREVGEEAGEVPF